MLTQGGAATGGEQIDVVQLFDNPGLLLCDQYRGKRWKLNHSLAPCSLSAPDLKSAPSCVSRLRTRDTQIQARACVQGNTLNVDSGTKVYF